MLDLNRIDLSDLTDALEDHSYDHSWWLDPKTGEVVLWSDWVHEQGEPHPADRGLRPIEPLASHDAYGDMQDFIDRVHDHRARELLDRAIQGRGAFRRFKDTLLDFTELREAWFRFHDVRMERRAIEWLCDERLVEPAAAEQALAEREDPVPPELPGAFDPYAIARAVSEDLYELYGKRLKRVLLFGSWARGDAHPESDVDLLVVLDRVESPWEELRRMGAALDRHSVENDTVVTALAVAEGDLSQPSSPVLIRASVEGRAVA